MFFSLSIRVNATNGFLINYLVVKHNTTKIKGFAVTIDNDTITGYFYLQNSKKGALVYQKDSIIFSNKTDSVFKMGTIKSVFLETSKRLYSPKYIEYTYFQSLGYFYHKVYSGNAEYYDNNFSRSNIYRTCRDVYILKKSGELLLVDPSSKYINRYMFKSSFKLLVDFYNKKYNSHYSYSKFINSLEVIVNIDKLIGN